MATDLKLNFRLKKSLSKEELDTLPLAKNIDLYGCHIRSDVLPLLQKNENLESLNLGFNLLGDKSVPTVLEISKNLKVLHFGGNNLSPNGSALFFRGLKTNTTLTHLRMVCNHIGLEGATALAELLHVNQTLKRLDLSYTQIGDDGARLIADVLKDNHTLTELNLYLNQIGDTGMYALAQALKINRGLTKLSLHGNHFTTTGILDVVNSLCYNTTLTDLDLSDSEVDDACLIRVAEYLLVNTSLSHLGIRGVHKKIGKEGQQALSDYTKIRQREIERQKMAFLLGKYDSSCVISHLDQYLVHTILQEAQLPVCQVAIKT